MPTTSFRISDGLKNDLDAIVYARSGPNSGVNRSDVLIEALEEYADKHSDEIREGWEKSSQSPTDSESYLLKS
ncbi:hypothetical protein [Natrinema pallidum]|uniref:hypothetical protein n=1 Tax=Natrinema pallidum TaxID=69527 RepID=UPI003751AD5E